MSKDEVAETPLEVDPLEVDPLEVDVERRADAIVVRVTGEIDSCTTPELREHLRGAFIDAANVGQPVVLDLRGVTVVASSGLSALIEHHRLGGDQGTPLRLVSPSGSVLRALRATMLDELLDLYASLPEALAAR